MVFSNPDLWPTPPEVCLQMLERVNVSGKAVMEPHGGTGNIIRAMKQAGATQVIACETDPQLRRIIADQCELIGQDFFDVTASDISHVKAIVMNPPFRNADKHILHAWDIAPEGCDIVALCNSDTLKNTYSTQRRVFETTLQNYGYSEEWGQCFTVADRKTDTNVTMVHLRKPSSNYDTEFEGFFLEEEPEGGQQDGILKYNAIQDIVNRYVAAVKLYDRQLEQGKEMHSLVSIFPTYVDSAGKVEEMHYFSVAGDLSTKRDEFKRSLQRRAWKHVFDLMDLNRHSTSSLKADINKFIHQQANVPFTMRNIYHMFSIVVGTAGARMDKALEEAFDKVTQHYDENRYRLPGWKTNSHYLVGEKFILPWVTTASYSGRGMGLHYNGNVDKVEDLTKALCFLTGKDYNEIGDLRLRLQGTRLPKENSWDRDEYENVPTFGKWFDWGFFECKGFKKNTMHFKFKDPEVWMLFNKNVARIKGFPLPEGI